MKSLAVIAVTALGTAVWLLALVTMRQLVAAHVMLDMCFFVWLFARKDIVLNALLRKGISTTHEAVFVASDDRG